ncbi:MULTISPECIES: GntR family transcriptional regulator [Anaerococcus]|jgi:hypothetical protein|uniref:GntR family transcriptional regulator n=1 Tax=Anaerococcus nagyae TaxID=1755241 RepID=A0A3E2TFC3_9FIRM|nr:MULTISPECIES: GntR family transcriptional regulator [Anaerococcus]MBP2068893.1 DNA-binding transcriptional regulator YhcF (GntR family) [Anaerococcus nagyae]MDU1828346.1 GntR family transcriptional regulator [Anaerococcus sp.]MDU1864938.1 GntR family transcriptional regulator [Anaerococcus sp.]MDU2353527.1 GntR family transcriptional regulator [Anaerococcus sp.]MDU2566030.1 GntR family transcriptional regulator [Anaerococcus sp.]
MAYKSKTKKIKEYIILDILKGNLNYGDKLHDRKFFTSLFKVNPTYVDEVFMELLDENLIENIDGSYYIKADEHHIMILRDEYLNDYINDFIDNLDTIDVSIDEAIRVLNIRNMANG